MKEINSQLSDAMIIALADAHDTGVNFSDATVLAKIPEIAIVEANEYWQFMSMQKEVSSNLFPEINIVDSLCAKMDTFVPEIKAKENTPSPYMKYVMVFAAPLSILVMIIGVSMRQSPTGSDIALNPEINSVVSARMAAAPSDSVVEQQTPAITKPQMMVAKMSKSVATQEEISKGDPKQLFAMLSDAGSQEALSETVIDEEYDAQISELDAKVIGTDNSSDYAPL